MSREGREKPDSVRELTEVFISLFGLYDGFVVGTGGSGSLIVSCPSQDGCPSSVTWENVGVVDESPSNLIPPALGLFGRKIFRGVR